MLISALKPIMVLMETKRRVLYADTTLEQVFILPEAVFPEK